LTALGERNRITKIKKLGDLNNKRFKYAKDDDMQEESPNKDTVTHIIVKNRKGEKIIVFSLIKLTLL